MHSSNASIAAANGAKIARIAVAEAAASSAKLRNGLPAPAVVALDASRVVLVIA